MSVEVDGIFYQTQLSAMAEQVRIMQDIMRNMMLRIDEMQNELEYQIDGWKVGLDTVDDEDTYSWCDCPMCRDDRSYRMD